MIGFVNACLAPLRSLAGNDANWKQKLRRIDFGGAVAVIVGVSMLLLGLDRGSNRSWGSPITLALLCLSIVILTIFFIVEAKIAEEPFAPGFVFFDRTMLACFLCIFFAYSCWLAIGYYLPLYWQAVESLTATQAAVRLLPGMGAGVASALVAGWVSGKDFRAIGCL